TSVHEALHPRQSPSARTPSAAHAARIFCAPTPRRVAASVTMSAKKTKAGTKKKAAGAQHRDTPESGLTKAEAKKALDAATKAIKSLKKQADKNFWQIGRR